MTKVFTKYVKTCDKYHKAKITKHLKCPITLTPTPFDKNFEDTKAPLPTTFNSNIYIVTVMCDMPKFLVTIIIANKSA